MDLLEHLADTLRGDPPADSAPCIHGLVPRYPVETQAMDGKIISVYPCSCGASFTDGDWDVHLTMSPDPRPAPTTATGTIEALNEHRRPLFTDLAQRLSACLICGHHKILHGKTRSRDYENLPPATPNGECSNCRCRTYRPHPELGQLSNVRAMTAMARAERDISERRTAC